MGGLRRGPGPLALFGRSAPAAPDDHGAGSHAHDGTSGGPGADEFRRTVEEFVERHRAEDGVVHPRRPAPDTHAAPAHGHGADAVHGGHDEVSARDHDAGDDPVEVYMFAEKWYYEPAHLRLDAGVRYRFRMMATDVSHGASIQFGRGGRMIRLRPNRVAEMEVVFERPGSLLVYCTVYCGPAHDYMQARIDVV